jgi:surface carbohydrate biosynthesis protein
VNFILVFDPMIAMRIAVPVETIVRELKGKLWLALNLIDDGHEVVFGELSSMKQGLDIIKPDVFFRTSTVYSQSKLDQNRYLNANGASIVVLDTEGGAFKTVDQYRNRRLDSDMLETVDRFFAWGNQSASIINSTAGASKEKTIVTGNPRFDVLQRHLRHIYKNEALRIKEQFGEFLLVNTNFGQVNPHGSSGEIPRDFPEGELFHRFSTLCRRINNRFPELTVIVRPHPGENHGTYKQEFADASGIAVEHHGDVRSWIYGSEAVVHNNCTTGIETALMERPVYAYLPNNISRNQSHLSNAISQHITSINELEHELKKIRDEPQDAYSLPEQKRKKLKQYIHNVDCSATDRIVEEVNTLNANWTGAQKIEPSITDRLKRVGIHHFGVDRTETIIANIFSTDYSKLRQKFPQLTEEELANEIALFDNNIDTADIKLSQLERLGYVYIMSK